MGVNGARGTHGQRRMSPRAQAALLAGVVLAAAGAVPMAAAWGNGAGFGVPGFAFYGVHDAVADLAFEKLKAEDPAAARFIAHWHRDNPGGYGDSFNPASPFPLGSDNFLGYTDDPDSTFQDWHNHLYIVHPRPGHEERGAPVRTAALMDDLALNLTAWRATGQVPCAPPEHFAAYNAGIMAHYVGDISQFGHTDFTLLDHAHPDDDPDDRTYHGYYESAVWGQDGLQALLDEMRGRAWTPDPIEDPHGAVVALAVEVNMPHGQTVTITDRDDAQVQVGHGYRDLLEGYAAAYDAGEDHHGMRGYTPEIWEETTDHLWMAVDLLADLYWTAWQRAVETFPLEPPVLLEETAVCPAA